VVHFAGRGGIARRAAADEVDIGGGVRVERGLADVNVPPVVGRKDRPPRKRAAKNGRQRGRNRRYHTREKRRRQQTSAHVNLTTGFTFHAIRNVTISAHPASRR